MAQLQDKREEAQVTSHHNSHSDNKNRNDNKDRYAELRVCAVGMWTCSELHVWCMKREAKRPLLLNAYLCYVTILTHVNNTVMLVRLAYDIFVADVAPST